MRLRRRVSDPGNAEVLGAVGLGEFARLALPDHPPGELELVAGYDADSGHILVSLAGAAGVPISASPADLAGALELPQGPVGLAKGVDAAVFASAEAIAAVSGFVRDRVILGGGGDGGEASGEVAAALRLVEVGKAYEVDWGGLVWAVVKGELEAGMPRRYAPYLIHLLERKSPGLFADFDGRLPRPKRRKGQQCHWDAAGFVALEEEEEPSFVYGGSQDIGDLEDMPIFGEGSVVDLLCRKMEYDEREGGCSQSSARRSIGDHKDVNVDVGPLGTTSYLPLQYVACQPLPTPSPFQAYMSKILGYLRAMESGYLDKEKACRGTRDEVGQMKKMLMEKECLRADTVSVIQEELKWRSAAIRRYEADMSTMYSTLQQCQKLLEKCWAEFQQYRMMCGEVAGSDSEVISSGQNHDWKQHFRQQMIVSTETRYLKSSNLLKQIPEVETGITKLNHEVQRIKESKSIPDLNNGKSQP
jgi:hypothetical protein